MPGDWRKVLWTAAADTFPDEDPDVILAYLDLYGTEKYEREVERVKFGILRLSQGDKDKLMEFIALAKSDWRDVVHWAENFPLNGE